mgnify:CR=1 FL=1
MAAISKNVVVVTVSENIVMVTVLENIVVAPISENAAMERNFQHILHESGEASGSPCALATITSNL